MARLVLDHRTVLRGDEWLAGLPDLISAYREAHSAARPEDLLSTVAVGCAWTLASAYPLTEVLDQPHGLDAPLQAYARARHETALTLLDRLDEAEQAVRDGLL
ncbi:hypothetical protein [Streptomyces botrytidirepellens]|uniref:hypothetical protein n=1 Tax=Streptomyces botrytidirepellens TaxID=2486417 RepID=UPI0011CE1C79|nr:hypothetical protein [Streptomyces botrytidirepellens]